MANQNIFGSANRIDAPETDAVNMAGGSAYNYTDRHALAQIAATNCFNGTYYASAEDNYRLTKGFVEKIKKEDPEFLAKLAIYTRQKAYMKDMPAYLVAILAADPTVDRALFRRTFRKVIDNGKMLRNFVQIGRSGAAGKVINMSSSSIRAAIQEWFDSKSPEYIFNASVGNNPSIKNIIKMAHPRPEPNSAKAALFAYLAKTPFNKETRCFECKIKGEVIRRDPWDNLPQVVRDYVSFKENPVATPPNVEFRLLTELPLSTKQWKEIARNAGWHMIRMNLAAFARYGIFEDRSMVELIANRLRNPQEIAQNKVFPYQLLVAYKSTENKVPIEIRHALQDAMEIATENVPLIDGKVYLAVDVSGSMGSSITGYRKGSQSVVRCVDVASLFAATILRKNQLAEVWPFDERIHGKGHDFNSRDSVMANANKLALYGGGGTNCGLVINHLNDREIRDAKAVIYISDNQSWIHSYNFSLMQGWKQFEHRNPEAKLVCIDLIPSKTSQVSPQKNILQVGGFSDSVFDVISTFINHGDDADHWLKEIEKIEI